MDTMKKQFQQNVQEMIDIGWFIEREIPTEVIFKDVEEHPINAIFTLLENETKQLLSCFPTITEGMFTHFINHEENNKYVEVEWQFHLHQRTYSMRAFFDPYLENKHVEMSFATRKNNQYESVSKSSLETNEKEELNDIFHTFKQMIIELPKYRLYFATQNIYFDEENVESWLEDTRI